MKNIFLIFVLSGLTFCCIAQKVGDVVTAKDNYNLWLPATILEVGAGRYKVHYNDYSSKWDAWVDVSWIRSGSRKAIIPTTTTTTTSTNTPTMTGGLPNIPGTAWKIIMYNDSRPVSVYLFCPNGKYEIVPSSAGSFVFMGTYKVQGSRLITRAEDGAVTTYTLSWKNGFLELNDGKIVLRLKYNGLRNQGC